MNPRHVLIALLLGGALAAGIFAALKSGTPAEPRSATVLPAGSDLPDFSLLDQRGAPVDADSFRGQWDLVFFGFTHCPDICPTTLQTLANVRRELIESEADVVPRIVLVSVDPERDTPEILDRYVSYFGPDNLGITGDLEQLKRLTSGLGIYFEKVNIVDDSYGVDHSAAVLVVDPDGKFVALFSAPHTLESYLHDLPIIAARR
ncbi:MAG TPA: SCO family protein [Woeseiaceae bacterium]|nr:SCO family protein [Woeseiaceae bacterium]